jgi:hypothetical protein
MTASARTVDGLCFTQDERGVGVSGPDDLRSFFVDTTLEAVIPAYEKAVGEARALFAARAPSSPLVDRIAREATFHWLYYYSVNRLPLEVLASDWEHTQTWRIIQQLVEERHPARSPEAIDACARLMGISGPEYLRWSDANELFELR